MLDDKVVSPILLPTLFAVALGVMGDPPTPRLPESSRIDTKVQNTHRHTRNRHNRAGDTRVDKGVEGTLQESTLIWLYTRLSLKPVFYGCQRARPRRELGKNAPDQRDDVKPAQHRSGLGKERTEHHPKNENRMQEQNARRERSEDIVEAHDCEHSGVPSPFVVCPIGPGLATWNRFDVSPRCSHRFIACVLQVGLALREGPVEHRSKLVFFFLVIAQAAHSVEEYVTRLYEVFAPARFVSGLVSNNLALGFLVVNVALVAFGLWCWAVPVRSGGPTSRGFVWFWIILELGNGFGHSILALRQGGYFPGLITAPLLLFFASWLAVLQVRDAVRGPQSI